MPLKCWLRGIFEQGVKLPPAKPVSPAPPLPLPHTYPLQVYKHCSALSGLSVGPQRRLTGMNISWFGLTAAEDLLWVWRPHWLRRGGLRKGAEAVHPAIDPLGPICADQMLCAQLFAHSST